MPTTRRNPTTLAGRVKRVAVAAVLAGVALTFAAAAARSAGEPAGGEPAEPSRGAVLYRLHCASCHGPEGRGDGPIAAELKTPPPDLTRFAARRGGRFSADEVARLIDGRTEVGPHGSAAMPVWGLSLRQDGRLEDQEEEIWLQIRELVRHLRSLQKGPIVEEG